MQRKFKFSESNWFAVQQPKFDKAIELASLKPGFRYLELGVYEGRSFCHVCEKYAPSLAIAVDAWSEYDHDSVDAAFMQKMHKIEANAKANILQLPMAQIRQGRSNVELMRLNLSGSKFDLIYIDAGHTAIEALRDCLLAWDLLEVGGLLIVDDYWWSDWHDKPLQTVKQGMDIWMQLMQGRFQPVINKPTYQLYLQKTHEALSSLV